VETDGGGDFGRYSQFVIQKVDRELPLPPLPPGAATTLAYLDDEVIKGAWNVITAWFWPRQDRLEIIPESHSHKEHEVVCFYGSNPDDPFDLCGEVEFYLEDQKLTLTKSSLVYIPANMKHCPLIVNRADRPIFHFSSVTESHWIRR
jgi:hypothetical protein